MESKVPNSFEVKTYRPDKDQFENFGKYINEIRKQCEVSLAAKVSIICFCDTSDSFNAKCYDCDLFVIEINRLFRTIYKNPFTRNENELTP